MRPALTGGEARVGWRRDAVARLTPLWLGVYVVANTRYGPLARVALAARWPLAAVLAVLGLPLLRSYQRVMVMLPAAFVAIGFASLTWSASVRSTIFQLVALIAVFVACATAVSAAGDTQTNIRALVRFLRVSCFAVLGTTVVSVLLSPSQSRLGGALRGPFENPNTLGLVLALTLPALGRPTSDRRLSRLQGAASVVGLALIYATRSRSALLATVCVLVIRLATLSGRRRVVVAYLALVAVVVSLSLGLGATVKRNFDESILHKGGGTLVSATRKEQFNATWKAARAAPLLGHGLGTQGLASPAATSVSLTAARTVREAGNSYLGIVEQVGLLGLVPLMLFFVATVGRIRNMALVREQRPDVLVLAALLVGGLVSANVEAFLVAPGSVLMLLVWMVLAALSLRPDRAPTPGSAGA